MTKRITFVFAGIYSVLTASGSAFAADLPVKAPPLPPPVYNWTGFYSGVNLGGVWGRAPHELLDADDPGTPQLAGFTNHPTGVIGGGQIGNNWQFNNGGRWGNAWVLGIEADIQGSSQRSTKRFSFAEGRAPGEIEGPGTGTPGMPGFPGEGGNGGGGNGGEAAIIATRTREITIARERMRMIHGSGPCAAVPASLSTAYFRT